MLFFCSHYKCTCFPPNHFCSLIYTNPFIRVRKVYEKTGRFYIRSMIYQKTFTVHTKIILNWMASFLPPNFHLKFPKLFYDQVLFATLLLKKKRKRKKFLFATLACQGGWHFKFILRKNISILNFFYIKKNKHIYLNTRNEFHIVALKIKK